MQNENQGCLTLLLQFLGLAPLPLPYKPAFNVMNKSELAFYRSASKAIGSQAIICTKTRIADILFVPRGKDHHKHFNRIAMKHIDFVLCKPENAQPIAAIEIDGNSHEREDRQTRDDFVNRAFQAAQIPLIRFPARQHYSEGEIANTLQPILFPQANRNTSDAPELAPKS